jgi:hypothetical protein
MNTEAWLEREPLSPCAELDMRKCPFCLVEPGPKDICWAIVSPWIRELGVTKRRISRYLICENCELGWFSLRYSSEGLENLYGSYRSEAYTAVRNRWESWYDKSYNDAHENPHWIKSRALAIATFLEDKVNVSESEVVDIGGDTGLISGLLGARSIRIVEISDRAASSKTQSESLQSIALLAHVLEHVSFPQGFLRNLLENYNSVYVEVPHGIPAITPKRRSILFLAMGILASLSPKTWRQFANPSAGRKHPAQLLRVSEHLTFFEQSTFERIPTKYFSGGHIIVASTSREIPSPDRSTPVRVIQSLWQNK